MNRPASSLNHPFSLIACVSVGAVILAGCAASSGSKAGAEAPPVEAPAAAPEVAEAPAAAPEAAPAQPEEAADYPAYTGEGKACELAVKGRSPVAKACSEGGVKEAKKTMKAMVKAAKAAGEEMECDGCHPDDEYGELTEDALETFKKLLAVYKE